MSFASSLPDNDKFIHQLAIKLSRALNTINPNDLLARRVSDIAKTTTVDEFINGFIPSLILNFDLNSFIAAKTFGRFKDTFLAELHAEILSHAKQEATGVAPQPVEGITVHDSEVLEPEPLRQGGLLRRDMVHCLFAKSWRELFSAS